MALLINDHFYSHNIAKMFLKIALLTTKPTKDTSEGKYLE
jgi:hypothetical protein